MAFTVQQVIDTVLAGNASTLPSRLVFTRGGETREYRECMKLLRREGYDIKEAYQGNPRRTTIVALHERPDSSEIERQSLIAFHAQPSRPNTIMDTEAAYRRHVEDIRVRQSLTGDWQVETHTMQPGDQIITTPTPPPRTLAYPTNNRRKIS